MVYKLRDRLDCVALPEDRVSPFAKHTLIYYVTGNPGFIEYYRNLFSSLSLALARSAHAKHQTQYHIRGRSLAGFELAEPRPPRVLSLNEIKRDLIQQVRSAAENVAELNGVQTADVPVILVGHSIGTWLILETITELQKTPAKVFNVAGGILLFPTVFDLAKSPNGLRAAWLQYSEYSAFLIALLSRLLFAFVPLFLLAPFIQLIAGMPRHQALVTASMLKSRRLVEQALYMAHGELRQVTTDVWSDDLWGVKKIEGEQLAHKTQASAVSGSSPPLYFYWGQNDRWVANATRDALIAGRARTSEAGDELKPVMEIDQHNLPHAFTTVDGGADMVADKIVEWIHDIECKS